MRRNILMAWHLYSKDSYLGEVEIISVTSTSQQDILSASSMTDIPFFYTDEEGFEVILEFSKSPLDGIDARLFEAMSKGCVL